MPISFLRIEIYIYIYMLELASVVEGSIDYCTRNVLEMYEMQAKLEGSREERVIIETAKYVKC